jgi:DNA-binding FadR family transcriptional regulator
MVRVGLVAYVEEQIERDISLGRLPRSGQFGSEEKLARGFGVSRGTVREALRRLAARGLVVQHPGRKTRAVALDESLTLENLGLALHDERGPESRRLLEGYFSLKRQVLVELLTDCCASASEQALDQLGSDCFALWDAARWEPGARCAQLEFELLRLAARVVDRPGHLLLIQSMQRALLGMADRVLPHMGGEAMRQWACCAMDALRERDAEALKRKLPALLKACDERVLGRLAPAAEENAAFKAQRAESHAQGGDARLEARPSGEAHGLGRLAPAEGRQVLEVAPHPPEALPVESEGEVRLSRAALGLNPGEPGGERDGGDLPGASFTNPSDCRTGSCASRPEGGPQPTPPPADSPGPTEFVVRGEGGPFHCTRGQHPPSTVPEGRAPRAPPLPFSGTPAS